MRVDPAHVTPQKPRGFIVLDGVNGAGKSTLQENLREYCASQGLHVCCTREPGSTEFGKKIRALILDGVHTPPPVSELLLFGADRAEHVSNVILAETAKGHVVLSDRYYYSTIAFQGYGRGIDRKLIDDVNRIAIQGVLPDLVLLLDLDPQEGLKRAGARGPARGEKDRLEGEHLDFHRRVRDGFLALSEQLSEPFVVLDAAKPPEQVFKAARAAVDPIIKALKSRSKRT
jgi:dTMP kinase